MGTVITVAGFRGEVPKRSRFLLRDEESSYTVNCILSSGELRPLHAPLLMESFSCTAEVIRYAYRMIDHEVGDAQYPELWLPFSDDQVNFLKGPLVKDLWERYYWTAHNGEMNQEEEGHPIQMLSRRIADPVTTGLCNTTGFRLGVPRPKMEPCVTTEILSPPLMKPHWDINNTAYNSWTANTLNDILGGEWVVGAFSADNRVSDNTNDWYGAQGRGGTFSNGAYAVQTYDELGDIFGYAVLGKNGWALVYDDPNPSRNGYYISGSATDDNPRLWKHCDTPPVIRSYSATARNDDEDLNGSWRNKQRVINRWTGVDAADFVADIHTGSTTDKTQNIPVEAFDYFSGSAPSGTFPGTTTSEWFGHFWVQQDPAGHTLSTDSMKSNLIDKVFPEGETEIVTRSYVYTYVNALGEEGPPSDPRSYDALAGESWAVYNFDFASVRNATDYPNMLGPDNRVPITSIKVYRTITGTSGSADYFFVTEIPVLHNIPDAGTEIPNTSDRELHQYPKYFARTFNDDGSLYNMAQYGVRTGDWLYARLDSKRSHGTASDGVNYVVNEVYKAVVRDYEGNITRDHISTHKWSRSLTAGQYGVEWVLQEGVFLNWAGFSPPDTVNSLVVIDNAQVSTVAYNDTLQTYSWYEPPLGLQGLTLHPNGFLCAFRGRDLFFSVPYRPHAWPEEFILTVEQPIVAIAVFDTSVLVMTEGHPYIATGVHPSAMSLTKYQSPVPCTSYDAVIPFPGAVFFSSTDGLWMASGQGITNMTRELMGESHWQHHSPDTLRAARDKNRMIAFYAETSDPVEVDTGFWLDLNSPTAAFGHLRGMEAGSPMENVANVQTDQFDGTCYLVANNSVWEFDPIYEPPLQMEWWSKAFDLPDPLNFGAISVNWRREYHTIHGAPDYAGDELVVYVVPDELEFDEYADRLSTIDFGSLWSEDDPLVVPQRTIRLKAGFKARHWWFRIVGNVVVEQVKLAEIAKDLKST